MLKADNPLQPGIWLQKIFGFSVSKKHAEAMRAKEESDARERDRLAKAAQQRAARNKAIAPPAVPAPEAVQGIIVEEAKPATVEPQEATQVAPDAGRALPALFLSPHQKFFGFAKLYIESAASRQEFSPVTVTVEAIRNCFIAVRFAGKEGQEVCRFYYLPNLWSLKKKGKPGTGEIMFWVLEGGWQQRHAEFYRLFMGHNEFYKAVEPIHEEFLVKAA